MNFSPDLASGPHISDSTNLYTKGNVKGFGIGAIPIPTDMKSDGNVFETLNRFRHR